MKKKNAIEGISRRELIKSAAAGSLLLGIGPTILIPGRAEAKTLEKGFIHHPNGVDPLRVVSIKDAAMTSAKNPFAPWKVQDKLVNDEVVANNLDRMASLLSEEKNAKEAWKKLLIKPPGKGWSDTFVAIKTNNLGKQHTRSGVMAKVCRVLTQLGVKGTNIVIYDACSGWGMKEETPFKNLPKGVKIAGPWGGSNTPVPIGKPWLSKNVGCIEYLAKGKVDILINIAVSKGHSGDFGTFTMCMKNHMGTFDPAPCHKDRSTDYLIATNRSPFILGEVDKKKNRIAFPRQQLCIVDGLWASKDGPQAPNSVQPNRLFMGTTGSAVDYLVATNFRKKEMGWPVNQKVLSRFLTDYGFSPSDLPNKGRLIEV